MGFGYVIQFTLWSWLSSIYYLSIGFLALANKYYKITSGIIIYICSVVLMHAVWCGFILITYLNSWPINSIFNCITASMLFIVIYFFLFALYTIIDPPFRDSVPAIVIHLITLVLLFTCLWNI